MTTTESDEEVKVLDEDNGSNQQVLKDMNGKEVSCCMVCGAVSNEVSQTRIFKHFPQWHVLMQDLVYNLVHTFLKW